MKLLTKCLWLFVLFPLSLFAQDIVTGTVTEAASGLPIPGANILIKGTANGTSTDYDGNFSISLNSGDVVVVTYVGFQKQEITYTGQSNLSFVMKEDAAKLNEVIIVGYGTTTMKSSTGALTAVTEKDFNQGNIATPENLLSGRVAGLSINTSGAPGSGSDIRIRGGASLSASNQPLIVIDGLPIDNDAVGGARSILSTINPSDIESFTVLKDAASTAVYGSRASNGVIIITTKKGGKKFKAEFNTQVGYNTLAKTIDVFSADEFRALVAEQRPQDVGLLGDANTDWQDEIYENQVTFDSNLSLNGSLFKNTLPVRFSARFTDRPGLRKTSEFQSNAYSLRVNPSLFDDHLKVSLNANLTLEDNRFSPGVEGGALRFDPTQPIYQEGSAYGGFFEFTDANGDPLANVAKNPVAELMQTRNVSEVTRYFGNVVLDYKFHFAPEFSALLNLGYDKSTGKGTFMRPEESALGVRIVNDEGETVLLGNSSAYENERTNQQFNFQLRYDKTINDFTLGVQGVYNYQKFESQSFSTGEQNDPNTLIVPTTNIDPEVVLLTYIGKGEVSYKDKYFLSASVTRDGTSRFSPDERFGTFPSVSAGWTISDDFFAESENFNFLKLRASYGVTGQQNIGRSLLFTSRFALGDLDSQYQFGDGTIPVAQPQFRNELLKWEETKQTNIGLDYGFFNNRISGSVEVYKNISEDLLSIVPIADGSNFSNKDFLNIGSFSSKGLEFTINSDIIQQEDLNWNVNFNAAFLDREIEDLALGLDIETTGIAGGTGGNIGLHREGFAPGSFYVYKQVYDASGNPIEGAFVDLNGDGLIDNSDRFISKNPDPDVLLGFSSTVNYKGFDLSVFLRASLGNYVYNNVSSNNAYYNNLDSNGFLANIPTSVLETNFTQSTDEIIRSDIYLEDASFLKMDNATLGYTIQLDDTKWGDSLRIWTGVQNAFVITDYSGLDPEVGASGVDNTIFPRARVYQFGANYKF